MSVMEAYAAVPPDEPGAEIEVVEGIPGFRTLDVAEIVNGEVVRKSFAVICVPQCITCNLPDRERYAVEWGVLRQRSYPAILKSLPEDSAAWLDSDGVTRVNAETARQRLSRHVCGGHSELEATVTRAMMEGFAASAAIDLEGTAQTLISDVGVLKVMQRRGFERMLECDEAPDAKLTVKVTELLMAHGDVAGDSHVQVASEGVRAVMAVLSKQLDPDTMQWVIAALDADPKVQALMRAAYEDIQG